MDFNQTCQGSFTPCSSSTTCRGKDPGLTAGCWNIVWGMAITGAFLLLYAQLISKSITIKRLVRVVVRQLHSKADIEATGIIEEDPAFVSYVRHEENFVRDNLDPQLQIPPPYKAEYEPANLESLSFVGALIDFWKLCSGAIFCSALGWGFLMSAVGTLYWLMLYYHDSCKSDRDMVYYFSEVSSVSAAFYSTYVFFPAFMLVGYLSFVVGHWREFMINCHTIQGRIHDIGLICGMSVKTPVALETRQRLFKIYRYLSCIHALTYQSVFPSVGKLSLKRDFVRLGLLTQKEVQILLPMDNKIRDYMLSWLGGEVNALALHDAVQPSPVCNKLTETVVALREVCAKHHDLFVRDNPNVYLHLMLVVVNLMVASFVLTSPVRMIIYNGSGTLQLGRPCFQLYVIVTNFLFVGSMNASISLICVLRNPFAATTEQIKVDNLMASTDRTLFAIMRGKFDSDFLDGTETNLPEVPVESGEKFEKMMRKSSSTRWKPVTEEFSLMDAREL